MVAAGHDVTVLTTNTDGVAAPVEDAHGVRIVRVKYWPRGSDLFFPGRVLDDRARRLGPRALSGLPHPGRTGGHAGRAAAGIPYVLTFHGGGNSSRLRNAVRGIQRALLGPLLARAARLIALAEFELDLFGDRLGIPRDHFVMIPNGADLPRLDDPVKIASAAPIIASIGRLERYKGHQRLIAALPDILLQRPDARVWIARCRAI